MVVIRIVAESEEINNEIVDWKIWLKTKEKNWIRIRPMTEVVNTICNCQGLYEINTRCKWLKIGKKCTSDCLL